VVFHYEAIAEGGLAMTMTGLQVFDTTVHKTDNWVNDITQKLHTDDTHHAFQGLRVTLHTLRDRLTVEEAAQLGAQLPILLAGFYYEGWKPAQSPTKQRSKDEFLQPIREYFQGVNADFDAETVVRSVFRLLSDRITRGEIEDITKMMPAELEQLWPEPVRA
jgi:uncharacterized protein (DUF2267 family)